jgi:CHAT domain
MRSSEPGGDIAISVGGDMSGQISIGKNVVQIREVPAPGSNRKIKVLFLAANPDYTSPLLLGEEVRRIEAEVRAAEWRDSVEFVSKWAVQPDDLQRALLEHRPQILHFSGHGSPAGDLLLEPGMDASPQGLPGRDRDLVVAESLPAPVSLSALVGLIRTLKDNLKVIVLNACFSESQAAALAECVDGAIGMREEIGDRAALIFSSAFYRAIGYGRSLQVAFDLGINAIQLARLRVDATPRLFTRAGIDASKIILIGP